MLGALSVNFCVRFARHQLVSTCLLHLLAWSAKRKMQQNHCVTPCGISACPMQSPVQTLADP